MTAASMDTTPDCDVPNVTNLPFNPATTVAEAEENALAITTRLALMFGDKPGQPSEIPIAAGNRYLTEWRKSHKGKSTFVRSLVNAAEAFCAAVHALGVPRAVTVKVAPKSAEPFVAKRGYLKDVPLHFRVGIEKQRDKAAPRQRKKNGAMLKLLASRATT